MTFCPVFMQADSTFENTMEGLHFLLLPLSEDASELRPLPFLLSPLLSPLSLLLSRCSDIFCHPFLMAPFMSNPDVPPGLPR
jgi:hypothetical protein